jgi:hypothetical protein
MNSIHGEVSFNTTKSKRAIIYFIIFVGAKHQVLPLAGINQYRPPALHRLHRVRLVSAFTNAPLRKSRKIMDIARAHPELFAYLMKQLGPGWIPSTKHVTSSPFRLPDFSPAISASRLWEYGPEIDRGWSSRPCPARGKAESQDASLASILQSGPRKFGQ